MISEIPEVLGEPVARCVCGACGNQFPVVWKCRTSPVYCTNCGEKVDP